MSRYVVSLGGNALGNNAEEQKEALKRVANAITDLIIDNNEVAIVHGNGPQVGMINLAFETSKETTYLAIILCLLYQLNRYLHVPLVHYLRLGIYRKLCRMYLQ